MHRRKVRTHDYAQPRSNRVVLLGYNIILGIATAFLAWYYTHEDQAKRILTGLIVVSVLFAIAFLFALHDVCLAFFWEEGLFSLYWFMNKLIRYTAKWAVCRPRFRRPVCGHGCLTSQAALCGTCRAMVTKSPVLLGKRTLLVPSVERHLHKSMATIEESAMSCTLCKILWDSAKQSGQDERDDGSENGLRDSEITVVIEQTRVWMVPLSMYSDLSLYATMGDSTIGEVVSITIEKLDHLCDEDVTTKSEITSKYAKDWIAACSDHRICTNGDSITRFTPTRLLSVHDPDKVYIIDGSSLSQDTDWRYIALSHCWGLPNSNVADVRTLDSNIDERRSSGIAVNVLPQNFQDAVHITRSLDIGYLWIDSLCIIQENAEDWKTEAATMGLVYSQAACTLSATASADTTGGCYYRRQPQYIPTGVSILRKDKNGTCLVVKSSTSSRQDNLNKIFDQHIEKAPVSSRGWCFQERMLARSVLHYCNGRVLFECNTLRASEAHIEGMIYREKPNIRADGTIRDMQELDNLLVEDEAYMTIQQRVKVWRQVGPSNVVPDGSRLEMMTIRNNGYRSLAEKQKEFLKSAALNGLRGQFQMLVMAQARETERRGAALPEKIEFHKAWYEIVEEFSKRNLTMQKDRLPAIQGVGTRLRSVPSHPADGMSGDFVAGLWEKNMLLDLLWKRADGAKWRKDVQSDTAGGESDRRVQGLPTWSWTSAPVHVETPLKHCSTETTKLLASETPLPIATEGDVGYRLRWLCQASEIRDLGNGFTADKPNFDISKHRKLFWIRIAAFVDDAESGGLSKVHGIVIRRKEESHEVYKRVGYMWQAMPGIEVSGDTSPRDIIIE